MLPPELGGSEGSSEPVDEPEVMGMLLPGVVALEGTEYEVCPEGPQGVLLLRLDAGPVSEGVPDEPVPGTPDD